MGNVTTPEVVADLRLFVKALKKRPDMKVVAKLGRKASKKDLAEARKANDPLAEFYAEMNGLHITWSFIEPSGNGCIRIPPYSPHSKFLSDFVASDDEEAMLFDEITPEGSVWFVREIGSSESQIVFGLGEDRFTVADSVAEYLTLAMKNGFCFYWPDCDRSDDEGRDNWPERALARFLAPPVKPAAIRPGVRVQFAFFHEGGRGEVLEIRDVSDDTLKFYAPKIALVQTDEGSLAWFPIRFLKAQKKQDAYEIMRDPAFSFTPDISMFEEIARAIGTHSRRAAGLLTSRDLEAAIVLVADLCLEMEANGNDLWTDLPIEKTGGEFSKQDFLGGWTHSVHVSCRSLFRGLCSYAAHESFKRRVSGTALVGSSTLEKLEAVDHSASEELLTLLTSSELLLPPSNYPQTSPKKLQKLGLDIDSRVFAGTGF